MIGFNAQNWIAVLITVTGMGVLGLLYAHFAKKYENKKK